jgi:hypothetical protein
MYPILDRLLAGSPLASIIICNSSCSALNLRCLCAYLGYWKKSVWLASSISFDHQTVKHAPHRRRASFCLSDSQAWYFWCLALSPATHSSYFHLLLTFLPGTRRLYHDVNKNMTLFACQYSFDGSLLRTLNVFHTFASASPAHTGRS